MKQAISIVGLPHRRDCHRTRGHNVVKKAIALYGVEYSYTLQLHTSADLSIAHATCQVRPDDILQRVSVVLVRQNHEDTQNTEYASDQPDPKTHVKTSSHPRLLREFSLVRKTIGIIVRNNGRLCRVKQELGESQQASREDNSGTYGGITAVIPSYPKMTSIGRSC